MLSLSHSPLYISISSTVSSHHPHTQTQTHTQPFLYLKPMELEAWHNNHFSQQIITNNRDFVGINEERLNNFVPMGSANPFATTMDNPWLGLNHQFLAMNNNMMIQPQPSPMKAESELINDLQDGPRKRARDSMENQFISNFNIQQNTNINVPLQATAASGSQSFSNEIVNLLETDFIISQYTKKIKLEIAARQMRDVKLLIASVRAPLVKKLTEKDEQILNMSKLNMALQERVKSLYTECQLWRDVANTNEATAVHLRQNLEDLLAQVSNQELQANGVLVDEDAESCCESNYMGKDEQGVDQGHMLAIASENEAVQGVKSGGAFESSGRMCKKCGENESCVLMLPCRHLCLCGVCGCAVQATCLVCDTPTNATLHVSLT